MHMSQVVGHGGEVEIQLSTTSVAFNVMDLANNLPAGTFVFEMV